MKTIVFRNNKHWKHNMESWENMISFLRWLGKLLKHMTAEPTGALLKPGDPGYQEAHTLTTNLDKNIKIITEIFGLSDDLMVRGMKIGRGKKQVRVAVIYLDPLINHTRLQQGLMHCLQTIDHLPSMGVTTEWLINNALSDGRVIEKKSFVEITDEINRGAACLLIEGLDQALLIRLAEKIGRAVEGPVTENVSKGAHDAFNEDVRTNIALLRKRLHTTRLAVENLQIGELTKTEVKLVYLKGYVIEGLVDEIKSRVRRIRIDAIVDSGQVEELIQDSAFSLFSLLDSTERPDKLAANLLEGKAGLLFDNTPIAIIIPGTLINQIQSPEDYYQRYWFSSWIRVLRWLALLTALLGPSLWIAIITFHQELLPTELLMTILVTREGVPFPGLVEALIMELSLEVLREAGLRLPQTFGQTISIVGAVVLGQAAVSAGLASPGMVIVVALTAIASFVIPTQPLSNTIRILRFPFMLLAASFGLIGIIVGFSILTYHLCSLRSYGIPFLSPLAPLSFGDLKDTLIRAPIWKMLFRPRLIGYREPQRQNPDQRPHPPSRKGKKFIRRRKQ